MSSPSAPAGSRPSRPTLGILLNDPVVYATYMRTIWEGAMAAAEAEDVNLLCFQGRQAEKDTRNLKQHLTLFSQMNPGVIDGLVVVGMVEPALWSCIPAAGVVPTVTIQPSQFPHLVADNHGGMKAAVEHLIEAHGRRRIAFVRGIPGERGAEERYRAYAGALREHGLPVDPALVCQGDYLLASGARAVEELIEHRRAAFDAVVAANDLMAIGALEGLASRGRMVPREISVLGFDDIDRAAFSDPPLTTVHQPLQRMGGRAVELVAAAARGAPLPAAEVVPTRLVLRRSCGCVAGAVLDAFSAAPPPVGRRLRGAEPAAAALLPRLREALRPCGGEGRTGLGPERMEQLAAALAADLAAGSSAFLDAVEELARDLAAQGQPGMAAQEALSLVRCACLPVLTAFPRHLARAEAVWHQARVQLDLAGQRRYQAALASREGEQETIESMMASLNTRDGVRGLTASLLPKLTGLGLSSAYLALHDDDARPARRSRLVLACHEGQPLPLDAQGEPFETARLLPARCLARSRRTTLLVNPLFYSFADDEQLGFSVLDLSVGSMRLREALGDQLASPAKSALVVEGVSREVQARAATEARTEEELRSFLVVMNALAEGDLTQRCREGEETLGRIGRYVNGMLQRFCAILAESREAARSVSLAAGRIRGAAADIATGALQGRDEVHSIIAAVHEMSASMEEVSRLSDVSAGKAQEVSARAQTSDRAMDAAFAAVTRMDLAVEETADKMRSLEERIEAIFGTVELIDHISQQVRLLSLNAAIQAMRAGEAGRGFAVVADELRRLTDNTVQATRSITQNLDAVRGETAPVTAALARALQEARDGSRLSDQARRDLHEITALMETLVQAATVIARASREQTQANQTVAEGMEAVARVSSQSTSSAAEAREAVEHLVTLSGDLNQAISRFKIGGDAPQAPPAG